MDDFKTNYNIWYEKIKPDFDHIISLLAEKLSDNPEELILALQTVEAWNARIGFILAEASSFVEEAKWFYLPTREQGTELDRKTKQNNDCADIIMMRDKAETMLNAIKQRLILGQSILAYQRQFKDPVILKTIVK